MVSILVAISKFEREIILSRISESRKRARQSGVRRRKPKLTSYQRQEALKRLAQGESQTERRAWRTTTSRGMP